MSLIYKVMNKIHYNTNDRMNNPKTKSLKSGLTLQKAQEKPHVQTEGQRGNCPEDRKKDYFYILKRNTHTLHSSMWMFLCVLIAAQPVNSLCKRSWGGCSPFPPSPSALGGHCAEDCLDPHWAETNIFSFLQTLNLHNDVKIQFLRSYFHMPLVQAVVDQFHWVDAWKREERAVREPRTAYRHSQS